MCGFVGFANLKHNISSKRDILVDMTRTLSKRGPDEEDFYCAEHIQLGHRRLTIIDPENGHQPMQATYHNNTYTIVYNGQLYNAKEIREDLIQEGYTFNGYCDTEVILKAFIHYGSNIVKKFNGIFSFAIWNEKDQELFLARDHFGIKPLYYCIVDDNIIFASEVKAIIKHPLVELKLDSTGISELLGIGPAHTPGTSVFKNIYEIKPAHFAVFSKKRFPYRGILEVRK